MQALTSSDREEILMCLYYLTQTHAGTNFMHEAFDPDRPEVFSRPWFAWANTLFAELLENLMEENFFKEGVCRAVRLTGSSIDICNIFPDGQGKRTDEDVKNTKYYDCT